MLDLDHLTITKTKPKPNSKRKLATVSNNRTENLAKADTDADSDAVVAVAIAIENVTDTVTATSTLTSTKTAAANISNSHMQNATHENQPTNKPSSSNALPFTTSSPKQCTYKHLTRIQHCLWIYLILSFCLPKCKCNLIYHDFQYIRFFGSQFQFQKPHHTHKPIVRAYVRLHLIPFYSLFCRLQWKAPAARFVGHVQHTWTAGR